MQRRLIELQLERGRLLERIAVQRTTLAVRLHPLARTVQVGERIDAWWQRCKLFALQHPLALAGAVGAIVVLRPAGVLRWARSGLIAWRTWAAVRQALPTFLSRWR